MLTQHILRAILFYTKLDASIAITWKSARPNLICIVLSRDHLFSGGGGGALFSNQQTQSFSADVALLGIIHYQQKQSAKILNKNISTKCQTVLIYAFQNLAFAFCGKKTIIEMSRKSNICKKLLTWHIL